MKKNTPLVSVIMPVYNAERYVAAAIESILQQTYQEFELIVVDDASTDSSASIIQAYKQHFSNKIRFIQLTKNLNCGGDKCANTALAHARGKYIARMDADDIAHPSRLAKQVAFLETHTDTFLVGTSAAVINKAGVVVGEKNEPLTHEQIKQSFFRVHPLIHPSCMFRRLQNNGQPFRYTIRYNANNDYLTFFTLLHQGYRFANLPEKLLQYRIHEQNSTFSNLKRNFMNTVKIRMHMINTYAYHASIRDIVILMAQTVIVFLIPNKILTKAYLLGRGFTKQQTTSHIHSKPLPWYDTVYAHKELAIK
jgi:glycosyltransferase involved in cell wall biosynthesis